MNKMNTEITPPFARQGNKWKMRKDIVPFIPPHNTYVEPFCGSGAIFFSKPKAETNVLNDIDKKVIERLNLLKECPTNPEEYPQIDKTVEAYKEFFDTAGYTLPERLVLAKIQTGCGFCNRIVYQSKDIYHANTAKKLIDNLGKYQDRLNEVALTTDDYPDVVSRYDSEDTFFFIDPPYESDLKTTRGFGYEDTNDFERLATVLSTIRGKFMMTINDSPRMRTMFSKYHIKEVDVLRGWSATKTAKQDNYKRKELIITNYDLVKN
jgi:DNA adenine methylase